MQHSSKETITKPAGLPPKWMASLGLGDRREPELYLSRDAVLGVRYASTMRQAFDFLGVSAIFCVQDVPCVFFLVLDTLDLDRINKTHTALWNQGLASWLLVIVTDDDLLRMYSLAQKPHEAQTPKQQDKRLLDILSLAADALALRDLITGVESGRLLKDYPDACDPRERIDSVLLANLMMTHQKLGEKHLLSEQSQALLMQAMFIAYLEDREIIKADYFIEATENPQITSFRELLNQESPDLIDKLFQPLTKHFNGDLFLSPCTFFEDSECCQLMPEHLHVLADFIRGDIELKQGQRRFWPYQFQFIPVELISAVYDRFLGDSPDLKRGEGAYYTPLFLADLTVDQTWEFLTPTQRQNLNALDPACGSGIFLVRLFERLVEETRGTQARIGWDDLLAILNRLHGWDKNPSAVRIAVFSLYIALLDQLEPREIKALMAQGKILPRLMNQSLKSDADFFAQAEIPKFDLIIGNPPWCSRKHKLQEAIDWCEKEKLPIPMEEAAWGFVWKSLRHIKNDGLVGLLLPAMAFLHNEKAQDARIQWLELARLERIINFSDLRFLLFDGAIHPATLAIFKPNTDKKNYRFQYWYPKANLNIHTRRLLTLSRHDRGTINTTEVKRQPNLFKHRLWMGSSASKLFLYLADLSSLSDRGLVTHGELTKRRKTPKPEQWVIGEGFKRAVKENIGKPNYWTTECPELTKIPFMDTKYFSSLVLTQVDAPPWSSATVHSRGYTEGFSGPRVLLKHGFGEKTGRISVTYAEEDFSFWHSIRAITTCGEASTAKLLTVILHSRLTSWFLFHNSSSVGTNRPRTVQSDLPPLPFPKPEDLAEPEQAQAAATEIIAVMDDLIARQTRLLDEDHLDATLKQIDQLVYRYYGLDEDEITVIEETFDYLIPAMQPRKTARPKLWNNSDTKDWQRYLQGLQRGLSAWFPDAPRLKARIEAFNQDMAIVRVNLEGTFDTTPLQAEQTEEWNALLEHLWGQVKRPVSKNVQVISDLRIFIDEDLYLLKPRALRHWLYTSGLDEADSIAAELFATKRQHTTE